MAMMAMTTRSSIKVNARFAGGLGFNVFMVAIAAAI